MKKYRDIPGDAGSNILGQVGEQLGRLQARLRTIQQVVVVMSGKGGVGKSAFTANLAARLAGRGSRVGVLDADINGPSVARMVGAEDQRLRLRQDSVEPAVGVLGIKVMSMQLLLADPEAPVIWRAPTQDGGYAWRGAMEVHALRQLLADTEWGILDFLLVDLPPGPDRLPAIAELLPPASQALAITIPSAASQVVVAKSLALARDLSTLSIAGLVENMAPLPCPHCGRSITLFPPARDSERLAARLHIPFLGRIPFDPRIAAALDRGVPFVVDYPDSPAAAAIDACAAHLFSSRVGGAP